MFSANQAFIRLEIDCVIAGGTRISWDLNPHMVDEGPYTFQLQFGHTGVQDADDWIDVGSPLTDTYYTIDAEKRVWGKTQDPHYRVKLITVLGTYYSSPESCLGKLTKRDWLTAREIVRKELLRHRVLTSPPGYLLKARRYGPRCTECTDEFTEEVSRTNCETCFGTGFENGYFEPMPACYADIGLEQVRDHRMADKGMDHQDVLQARFIGDPQLYSYDVWTNQSGGSRYYIHTTAVKGHVRGVPLVYDVEMRKAPYSDVIYTLGVGEAFMLSRKVKQCPTTDQPQRPQPRLGLNYLEIAARELAARRNTRSSKR